MTVYRIHARITTKGHLFAQVAEMIERELPGMVEGCLLDIDGRDPLAEGSAGYDHESNGLKLEVVVEEENG